MSYTNLIYHIVFSTKERRAFLADDYLARTCKYLGGIIRNIEGVPLIVNGMADHVHIAMIASPKMSISDQVSRIKANSSRWIHKTFRELGTFSWQEGYGAFSVSHSAREAVVAYIECQREHHHKRTFDEELKMILDKHEMAYDPKYL